MEIILFDNYNYQKQYNCSNITAPRTPLEQRQHVHLGLLLIVLTAIYHVRFKHTFLSEKKNIFQILYIPCLFSLRKLAQDNSCYKFLFFIGILDVMALWMCGFLTGIFAILGTQFCDCPTLNYAAGAYGLGALKLGEKVLELLASGFEF